MGIIRIPQVDANRHSERSNSFLGDIVIVYSVAIDGTIGTTMRIPRVCVCRPLRSFVHRSVALARARGICAGSGGALRRWNAFKEPFPRWIVGMHQAFAFEHLPGRHQ